VKDKYYIHISNKSTGGSKGYQFSAMQNIQELLVFGPKAADTKSLHLNYQDPRVDWSTVFLDEYVCYRCCNYNCKLQL